jgi:hypothetical protein
MKARPCTIEKCAADTSNQQFKTLDIAPVGPIPVIKYPGSDGTITENGSDFGREELAAKPKADRPLTLRYFPICGFKSRSIGGPEYVLG